MQNFWDPELKEEFHYNQIKSCWKPEWWLGEPVRMTDFYSETAVNRLLDVGERGEGRHHHREPDVARTSQDDVWREFDILCAVEGVFGAASLSVIFVLMIEARTRCRLTRSSTRL